MVSDANNNGAPNYGDEINFTFTQTATIPVWNLPVTLVGFILIVCIDTLVRKRRGMV